MTTATLMHRPFLLDEGEGLLLTRPTVDQDGALMPGVVKMSERRSAFEQACGLASTAVTSTPLVSVPLPDYAQIEAGRRRWAGTSPSFMWHPLMWLPERVAMPCVLAETGEDGQVRERLESADEHAVRIAFEVPEAGLYDPVQGGWVDVLALHGLNLDTPGAAGRVQDWLDGGADPVLDGIDMSSAFDAPQDPSWAAQVTQDLFDDLVPASWHLVSRDLLSSLQGIEDADPPVARARLAMVAQVATDLIGDAVINADLDVATRLGPIIEAIDDGEVDGPAEDLQEALTVVASAYLPALELLDSIPEQAE